MPFWCRQYSNGESKLVIVYLRGYSSSIDNICSCFSCFEKQGEETEKKKHLRDYGKCHKMKIKKQQTERSQNKSLHPKIFYKKQKDKER